MISYHIMHYHSVSYTRLRVILVEVYYLRCLFPFIKHWLLLIMVCYFSHSVLSEFWFVISAIQAILFCFSYVALSAYQPSWSYQTYWEFEVWIFISWLDLNITCVEIGFIENVDSLIHYKESVSKWGELVAAEMSIAEGCSACLSVATCSLATLPQQRTV